MGLFGMVAAGIALLSLFVVSRPLASVPILIFGRALMGGAESLIITGGMVWVLGLVRPEHAGRSISWVGMAMFAAMAAGAPVGGALYAVTGFAGIAAASVLLPLAALMIARRLERFSSGLNQEGFTRPWFSDSRSLLAKEAGMDGSSLVA